MNVLTLLLLGLMSLVATCFTLVPKGPVLYKRTGSHSRCSMQKDTPQEDHSIHSSIRSAIGCLLVCGSFFQDINPSLALPTATKTTKITAQQLENTITTFEQANTRDETVQAFADLYDATGEKTLLARTKYKNRVITAINDKRSKLSSDWDQALGFESKELKRRVDPYRTVDLAGYLKIAPYIGGAGYLGALFVQQAIPELFIFAYPFAVFVLTAPIIFIITVY